MTRSCRLSLLLLAGLLPPAGLAAQDAHYWAETYGTYATLLGGVVVGRVPDLSATYYNPGRLAFATRPAVSLTTRVFQLRSSKMERTGSSATTDGDGLGTTTLRPSPSFAGGVVPVGTGGRKTIAYTLLTRQFDDQRFYGASTDTTGGVITGNQVNLVRTTNETWGGVAMGYKLDDRTGVGVTLFGAYRGQYQRGDITSQVAPATDIATITSQFDYYDVRLLLKAGISTELGAWSVGATVTTPGLHLFGSGGAYYAELSSSAAQPLFAFREQQDIGVNYRSSWAVAGGLARTWGKTTVYGMAEWFDGVDKYALVDADTVVPQDARAPFQRDLVFERQSVVNWGFGLQHRVAERRSVFGYFKVDNSARPKASAVNATYDRWGLWHAGGGYAFRLGQWDLVAGLAYSRGGTTYTAGDGDQLPDGGVLPAGASVKFTDSRLRFLFGFNVSF